MRESTFIFMYTPQRKKGRARDSKEGPFIEPKRFNAKRGLSTSKQLAGVVGRIKEAKQYERDNPGRGLLLCKNG